MKRFYDHGVLKAPQLKVSDRVYLEREKHPKGQPTSKLAPRRDGPYEILEKVGTLNYRLKLTRNDKRHPVFHVDRLRPAKAATVVPDRQMPEPPPIVVNEEAEYEVESILDARIYRNKFQYLIKWKGYSDKDNSWEPAANVKNAPDAIAHFYRKHPGAPRTILATTFLTIPFRNIHKNFEKSPENTLNTVKSWEDGREDQFHEKRFRRNGLLGFA